MDLLRERKVVNAGDLLRFELEGLSAGLPSYKRVLGYEIWFEPLPQTTTGKLKRHEIVRRLTAAAATGSGSSSDGGARSAEEEAWLRDPHVAAAMEVVRRRARDGTSCRMAANLEMDLGLDSMERVELLTELEQQFGVTLTDDQEHAIFTVRQLVEAVRPTGGEPPAEAASGAATGESGPSSWDAILRDLPPPTDPALGGLLERRPLLEPLLFAFGRAFPRLIGGIDVRGLEHLPRDGAFLISPEPPELRRRVLRLRCAAAPHARQPVLRRRRRVLRDTADGLGGAQDQLRAGGPDSNLVPAMKAGAFGLAHGKILMLFPEGERSIDGTVRRFKKGAPILARHHGVPIVPVAIRGAHEVWPRGGAFDWRTLLPWSRRTVTLRFGAPFRVAEGESDADAAERLRQVVTEMWERS